MSPETVVEVVQETAAAQVASEVASDIRTETAVVTSEVAAVSEQLAEHAELSEDRHEEILEENQWQNEQFQLLQSNLNALQVTMTAQAQAQATQNQALLSSLETLNQRLSTGLNLSTQAIPVEAEPVILEPVSAVEDRPVPSTESAPKKRLRMV